MIHSTFSSRAGGIKVFSNENNLIKIEFLGSNFEEVTSSDALLAEAKKQILAFLAGDLTQFNLPYQIEGTDFQKQVWSYLTSIPFGELRSYLDVAIGLRNPKAVRAVGGAANKNPLPLLIPCHRVIGKSGRLVGFAPGLDLKGQLLGLEGHRIIGNSVT
jgi:methylated-DNA-[protein]-cysteine S-methyltransferase